MAIIVGPDGRVRVPSLGLDLIANGITPDEARGCAQLLQAAEVLADTELPSAGSDGWRQHVDQAGRLNPDLTEPRDPDGGDPHTTNLPQPDPDVLQTAATTSEDLAVLAPTIPEPVAEQLRDSDPTLDADLADWFSDICTRLACPFSGRSGSGVGPGGDPGKAAKRKPYYTELVAYLATRPHGATSVELCNAFAATPARLQRDLAVVRQWLGVDPDTGLRHLPDATRSQLFHEGRGVYQLHNLLSDADLFRRLRLRGQPAAPTDSPTTYKPSPSSPDRPTRTSTTAAEPGSPPTATTNTCSSPSSIPHTSPSPWRSKSPTSRWPGSPPTSPPPLHPTKKPPNSTSPPSPKPKATPPAPAGPSEKPCTPETPTDLSNPTPARSASSKLMAGPTRPAPAS